MTRALRVLLVSIASLLVAALALSACSSPDESADEGAPIQVNTSKGSVTINGVPKRIVTLGAQWIDVTLSFGITPVAYLDNIQVLTGSPAPWASDQLQDSTPISTDDIVAQVAKAEPDLILATSYMADGQPEIYDSVSKLAPTIPGITGKQIDPWQDMVTFLGTVLREPEKAKEITAGVDEKINAAKQDMPGLNGKTYTMAYMFSNDQIQVMADPDDGATYLFSSLGMTIAPQLVAEFRKNGQPRFPISTENVPMLDSDLLVVTANTDQQMNALEKLPGYQGLRSVESGAVSRLSVAEIGGLNEPTPLSIPYVLDKMYPALQRAAA
ncbi:MAG: ABC transporter substrate-binding protein [Gordonia sp.]|uniref:ABC transporter substrate-binding protein n=1 Tax=Gordonia sp. (in: high G+C Gram-positive bacteria) TaxID=84139 RepID=UPI000C3A3919|nr:ABC transporter substrate-binding protein [Gordonia sp. (in: high G+C Gram-positive bacteria)]MAU81692.1 ABC transporter substrate-binding protein [Gordonia sp. (in: high G+C Gram-positive bacteria)]